MKSHIAKLNPHALRDMVVNYDELADEVARTEFAGFLEAAGRARSRHRRALAAI
jgi:hypothetical protein